jgi:acyl carrier protein
MSTTPDRQALLELVVKTAYLDQSPSEAANLTLAQLGLDSLGIVEIAMAIEDQYQLQLDVDQLKADTTLGALIDSILPKA